MLDFNCNIQFTPNEKHWYDTSHFAVYIYLIYKAEIIIVNSLKSNILYAKGSIEKSHHVQLNIHQQEVECKLIRKQH